MAYLFVGIVKIAQCTAVRNDDADKGFLVASWTRMKVGQ